MKPRLEAVPSTEKLIVPIDILSKYQGKAVVHIEKYWWEAHLGKDRPENYRFVTRYITRALVRDLRGARICPLCFAQLEKARPKAIRSAMMRAGANRRKTARARKTTKQSKR